jgi:hypothetical protein
MRETMLQKQINITNSSTIDSSDQALRNISNYYAFDMSHSY